MFPSYFNSVCHGQPDVNTESENPAFWAYKCNSKHQCERFYVTGSTDPDGFKGLTECKLTCGPCSRLWPKPNEGYIQPLNCHLFSFKITIVWSKNFYLI